MATKNKIINASAALGVVSGGMMISFTSILSSPTHSLIAVTQVTGLRDSGHTQTDLLHPQVAPSGLNIAKISRAKKKAGSRKLLPAPF